MRRIPQSPPNYYTLLNIGQDQPVYATDYVSMHLSCLPSRRMTSSFGAQDVAFQDQNQIQDVEKFVFTGTNQRSYYIANPNNDENYVVRSATDND